MRQENGVDSCSPLSIRRHSNLILGRLTVGAVYDRPHSQISEITGGHRPPLQQKCCTGTPSILLPPSRSGPCADLMCSELQVISTHRLPDRAKQLIGRLKNNAVQSDGIVFLLIQKFPHDVRSGSAVVTAERRVHPPRRKENIPGSLDLQQHV